MSKSIKYTERKGQSLLLVLLTFVVIAGILALTLDFGFVLQSKRLMQTGVNTAALEGLRNRDVDFDNMGDGRENAGRLLRNVFDDDMDPTQNTTTVGAGIDSTLVQGNGFRQTLLGNGSGTQSLLEDRSSFIYRPDPQLNSMNLPHGDLVTGDYQETATDHSEFSDYVRNDFTVSATGDNPTSFLVRMRRTHDPDGLDRVAGVSSGSGGLPLMMGRLGWFSVRPADAEYAIRRDGVLVRATAIADEKVSVRVWPSNNAQIYSALSFGVSKSDFVSLANFVPQIRPTTSLVTQYGQLAGFAPSGSYSGAVGYIAVIDEALVPPRAIGFVLLDSTTAQTRQANASSRMQDAWGTLGDLSSTERAALNASRQDAIDNSPNNLLTSGALVRSTR